MPFGSYLETMLLLSCSCAKDAQSNPYNFWRLDSGGRRTHPPAYCLDKAGIGITGQCAVPAGNKSEGWRTPIQPGRKKGGKQLLAKERLTLPAPAAPSCSLTSMTVSLRRTPLLTHPVKPFTDGR